MPGTVVGARMHTAETKALHSRSSQVTGRRNNSTKNKYRMWQNKETGEGGPQTMKEERSCDYDRSSPGRRMTCAKALRQE